MTVPLTDRALLVKLYYQNDDSAATALRRFRTLKNLRTGPMTTEGLRKMVLKFEQTGSLSLKPGRGRKPIDVTAVEGVATALEEGSSSGVGSCSARGIARTLGMSVSTVHKVLRKIMRCYPYKITHVQELLAADLPKREKFALQFLARMEVDIAWPYNILWTDEAHFHLQNAVNTQNCRIWATENPNISQPLPLHSPKVTVWCGFTAEFVVGPYFFEEVTPAGPVTCTVNSNRYKFLLSSYVIPALQQRQCLDSTVFMQDGATPHIATQVKDLLQRTFGNDRIISRNFPTAWPARSPDLNPCDFWLWGYLKNTVYCGGVTNLADLKARIVHQIHSIQPDTLRSVVEHAVSRFQLVAEHGGQHIENLLR